MESVIFSKEIISVKAYDVEDGHASLVLRFGESDKVTLFAGVGHLYAMAQAIENALDDLDISPCEQCREYVEIFHHDESGHYCEECWDGIINEEGRGFNVGLHYYVEPAWSTDRSI
jgi:hypothetical protein